MKVGDKVYRISGGMNDKHELEKYTLKAIPENGKGVYLIKLGDRTSTLS